MKTSDILWENASEIIKMHLNHQFSQDLANGSLPLQVFQYYLQQDSIYIKKYAQAMNILASKAPSEEINKIFSNLSAESYELEHIFQEKLFNEFNVSSTDLMQPACLAYSSYLIATISSSTFLEGLTALLPCFWVYLENGKNIALNSVENNSYQAWIDTYISEEFILQTELVKEYVNFYGKNLSQAQLDNLCDIFSYSCRLDLQFMDDAYNLRKWYR